MASNLRGGCCKGRGVPEPCVLDRCMNGWTVKLVSENLMDIESYEVKECYTSEKLIFEVNRNFGEISAKNEYGQCLFKLYGAMDKSKCMELKLTDGFTIGKIRGDKLCDCSTNTSIVMTDNMDDTYTVHPVCDVDEPFTIASWCGTHMNIDIVNPAMNNIVKALILSKLVHIVASAYQCTLDKPNLDYDYKSLDTLPLRLLQSLENISQLKLMKVRSFKASTGKWYYHLRDRDNRVALVFEEEDLTGHFRLKNKNDIQQFTADGFEHFEGQLCVNLHGNILIGSAQDNRMHVTATCEYMCIKHLTSPQCIAFKVLGPDGKVLANIHREEEQDAIQISINPKISTHKKAIILTYTFKVALNFYEFVSVRGKPCRPLQIYEPRMVDTSLCAINDSTFYTIAKGAHCVRRGVHYWEVSEENSKVAVVFETIEKLGSVEAIVRNSKGVIQFFVTGLWDMKKDMIVYLNSGEIIGIERGGAIFDAKSCKLMVERRRPIPRCEFEEDEEEEEECDDDEPEYVVNYRQVDPKHCNQNDMLAEVSTGSGLFEVELSERLNLQSRALILSYAIKLAYNTYKLHKAPTRDIEGYPY